MVSRMNRERAVRGAVNVLMHLHLLSASNCHASRSSPL